MIEDIEFLSNLYGIPSQTVLDALLLDMVEFYPAAHAIDPTDGFIADDFLGRVCRYNELVDSINEYRVANGKTKIDYPVLNSIIDYIG